MKKLTEQYARHAERHGLDEVWETAKRDLPPLELGYLSLQLRRIDRQAADRLDDRARRRRPVWKLPQDDARELVAALAPARLPDRKLAAMVTVTTRTVRNWRANPDTALDLLARRRNLDPDLLARAAAVFARPDGGGPVDRLARLELLGEIAVAACRPEPNRRLRALLEKVEHPANLPRKPAFQSGEKRKIGPTLGNGSDLAKKTPAPAQTLLFEEAPAA